VLATAAACTTVVHGDSCLVERALDEGGDLGVAHAGLGDQPADLLEQIVVAVRGRGLEVKGELLGGHGVTTDRQ
jgi:hypothetical protein